MLSFQLAFLSVMEYNKNHLSHGAAFQYYVKGYTLVANEANAFDRLTEGLPIAAQAW